VVLAFAVLLSIGLCSAARVAMYSANGGVCSGCNGGEGGAGSGYGQGGGRGTSAGVTVKGEEVVEAVGKVE
jgi:hypothetical protein